MLVRFPLAFLLGLLIYMIAMAMTVYDGVLSMLFQPIMGSILTTLALLVLCIVGSPLLLPRIWRRWRRAGWAVLLITFLGVVSFVASWNSALRVRVIDPETNATVESFHPVLSVSGWLLAMFGLLFCPKIGFRGDRRWV